MIRAKQDVLVAALLLLFCGVMIWASYDIRDLGYPGLKPESWPRFLLILLSGLCGVYLITSIKKVAAGSEQLDEQSDSEATTGPKGWKRYQNATWCFVLFFFFLFSLDYIGMLLGGILFVFALLTALGEKSLRNVILHAVVALISVGIMWMIFTYSLRVNLPEGELLSIW